MMIVMTVKIKTVMKVKLNQSHKRKKTAKMSKFIL